MVISYFDFGLLVEKIKRCLWSYCRWLAGGLVGGLDVGCSGERLVVFRLSLFVDSLGRQESGIVREPRAVRLADQGEHFVSNLGLFASGIVGHLGGHIHLLCF